MRAVRIHQFGSPEVVTLEDVPVPQPRAAEVLVRVHAAGVAPWDALIREGKSKVSGLPPLTLGSDLAGVIESVGPGVTLFAPGQQIYGVTNSQFCGAQAEFAIAAAGMIAPKPARLDFLQAASVPVVAVTAWQMLFEYAQVRRNQTVMVLGAAGSVGQYAVQMALNAGVEVIAVVRMRDAAMLRQLGVQRIVDADATDLAQGIRNVDGIFDLVGGDIVERSINALKPGGNLISVVSSAPVPNWPEVQANFFYAEVTTERLKNLTVLFDSGKLKPHVGPVLSLCEARQAHQMLAGSPRVSGKIVLDVTQAC